MDSATHLNRLTGWLLAQNSPAARLLSVRPDLLANRLAALKSGQVPDRPKLEPEMDEELGAGLLRNWQAEGLLALTLGYTGGRLGPTGVAGRLAGLNGGLIQAALELADNSLRARYHHPLLPSGHPGPGPVVVLGGPSPNGAEPGFDTPYSLLVLFQRGQGGGAPLDEEQFQAARGEPKLFIILRDYILKLAQRIIDYLTMDLPQGPGLNLAPPEGSEPGPVGPQISPISRFVDFFKHQTQDGGLMGLTRLNPLAGDPALIDRLKRTIRSLVLARPWTETRLAEARASLPRPSGEGFDPLTAPGGLTDLAFGLDALLLASGRFPAGDNRSRLKAVASAGLVARAQAEDLTQAYQSLLSGHLVLSLLGRDLPGHPLMTAADLDAALALKPGRGNTPLLPLERARSIVRGLLLPYQA